MDPYANPPIIPKARGTLTTKDYYTKILPRTANAIFQGFFNAEWAENREVFANNYNEAVTIVLGIMLTVEGPDGTSITPGDIAQVLRYRDPQVFVNATGNMVRDFFRKLEKNKSDPVNPFRRWELKRQLKEKSNAKGHREEPDPEFDDIKRKLQGDLAASKK